MEGFLGACRGEHSISEMEYHSNPSNPSATGLITRDLCPLALRFVAGLTMIYFQAWHQSIRAWAFVWDKKSWSLVDQIEELGLGLSGYIATTLVVLCAVLSLGVITGIYTRICALLLLVMMVFLLIVPVELSGNLNVQTLLLYAGISFTLVLSGGGRISLDYLLTKRKRK